MTLLRSEQTVQPVFWGDCTEAIRSEIASLKSDGRRVALIASAGVLQSHADWANDVFRDVPCMSIPPGEGYKNLETLAQIYAFLAAHELDRASALIVWGGGVVGDVGGFAAASFLRGIRYYQIPTTLLGMVDSAIGGKTGINLPAGKNLVGAVHLPSAVWVDPRFVKTLPAREFASGMAEVIKSALLGDRPLWERLRELDPQSLAEDSDLLLDIIEATGRVKLRVIAEDLGDEKVTSGRAWLNLGHTFGHAIEAATHYQEYAHGEAVAIGLVLAARLSEQFGFLNAADVAEISAVIERFGLPTRLCTSVSIDILMEAMQRDKKKVRGVLHFVLIREIGQAISSDVLDVQQVRNLWREVGAA